MPARVKSESIASSDAYRKDDKVNDDDDEVVQEIDVFLSPELSKQLHLLQYPLQQTSLSTLLDARIKPNHCMIELDYEIPDAIGEYGSYDMEARSFTSHTIPISTHMALGRMIHEPGGGDQQGLHLVPLSRITQMRPSFSHVNEASRTLLDTSKEEAAAAKREAEASKLERKPITLQKKESERAALARKSTFAYKKHSEDSEAWKALEVYDMESMEADEVMDKVICTSTEESIMTNFENTTNSERLVNEQYVQTLNYLSLPNNGGETQMSDDDEGDTVLTCCTRLVEIMKEGYPIPFSVLRNRFPKPVANDTLFEALGSCAFLVRGNFVLDSKFLPIRPSIAFARTFILFLFQTIEVLHRSRLEHVYDGDEEVTPEVILMLLQQVGTKTPRGWQLKVEDDPSFAEKYKAIFMVHINFWSKLSRRFRPLLDRYRQDPKK